MKKFTRSLLLTAALFSMAACSAPAASINSVDGGNIAGPVKGPDESLAITYQSEAAVTVTGPATAVAGSKVTFSLAYNIEEYAIDEIRVNNDLPSFEGNNSFSFRMPESAVTVTVRGHYVDPNHGKSQIVNLAADKGVVLFGAPDYAAEGETVSFTVKFAYDSPYTFTDVVSATHGNNEDVTVDHNNGVYSFTMPADAVSVNVGLEANKYKLIITNTEKSNNFAGSPFAVLGDDEAYKNLSAEYFSDYNVFYASDGQTVRAKVKKSSDRLVVEGIKLEGAFSNVTRVENLTEVPEEEYYYASFTMPAYDVDVSAFGSINYKTVTVVNSDHFAAVLQSKVDDQYVDIEDNTQIVPGDVVYVAIRAIGEPDEDIVFEKLTLSDGYLSTDTAGSLYHFTMSNKDNVTLTVSEKNMAQYKNYPFIGTHYGANLDRTTASQSASMSSSYGMTIAGDGSITKGTSTNYSIASVEEKNNGSFGVITTADSKEIAYSGKFVLSHYNLSQGFDKGFGGDYLVAVLAQAGDTSSNYKFYYRMDSGKTFLTVQAFRVVDGAEEAYAVMFYDRANAELYSSGVTLNFTSGEKVSESTAAYTIEYNGTTIGKVESGATYTCLLPHPQALTVTNSTHYSIAIYDGETLLDDTSAINAGTTLTAKLSVVDAGDGLVENTDYAFDKLAFTGAEVSTTEVTKAREYTFKMPKADIALTVSEKDLALFKGYPFIGSFYGANLYGSAGQKTNITVGTGYGVVVTPDGTMTKGGSTKFTITEATSATGDGLGTLSNGKDFFYSDKFVFGHYSFSYANSSAFDNDYLVAVKYSDGDATSLYKYNWQMGNSKNFISVEAYKDGVLYACMFYDAVNKEFYGTGLVFDFKDEATSVGSSKNYDVKVNGVVVGTVTNGAYAKA